MTTMAAQRLAVFAGLIGFLATISLSSFNANAFSDGTNGWGVAVAPGVTEWYSSPGAACRRQFDVYAWPGSTFLGYDESVKWTIKKCSWIRFHNNGSFPATVSFSCKSGYSPLPGGTCVKTLESQPVFQDDCTINNGGNINVHSKNPIDIITGAKLFRAVDFKTTDGSLLLERVYNSRSYSGSAYSTVAVAAPVGLGVYWKFWFQHELLFSKDFPYNLEIDLGDGLSLPFVREASGQWSRASGGLLVPTIRRATG